MPSAKSAASSNPPRLGRPPGSTSDATRRRILEAACDCFGEKGYESTTNRDIGDRAGVTAPAIYQYFDSKLALFVECFRAAHDDVVTYLRDAVARADTSREALKALILAYAETWRIFPSASAFLSCIPGEVRRHSELAPILAMEPNTVLTIVAEIVERGVEAGEIERAGSWSAVGMCFAVTLGLAQNGVLAGERGVRDAAQGYVQLLDGQIFQEAPEKSRAPKSG
jgi:AcrR family transcriptional regulator